MQFVVRRRRVLIGHAIDLADDEQIMLTVPVANHGNEPTALVIYSRYPAYDDPAAPTESETR